VTREEQKKYIEDCLESQRRYLMERIARVPENWDGIELRNWFVDAAVDGYRFKMDRKRAKDYRNDIIVNNL
jgi:hypothetical protein